ncbi:hypothetical protein HMPREF1981_00399 [Bacteroides pyogenes F0041]|uniref:Uncharacterized protein n=1 Tax=Bacteroides pyogenes F0041 TaxID=1321819 RepID=U2CDP4_9BACE|nr:hypothetical protein HMPREF1981_00399 [Bacteroides pyogenes F0041]
MPGRYDRQPADTRSIAQGGSDTVAEAPMGMPSRLRKRSVFLFSP